MKPTICLDFNGVLDTYIGWKGEDYFYPPRQGVAEFLNELSKLDYRVVILTTIETEKVRKWLRENGLNGLVEEVSNIKPPAFVYVDDRAICFRGSFQQTLKEIESFKTHWETNKD
jgi:hypothetical protein